MATSGLYGSTTTGDLVATSGAESTGLYGNNTNIGGTYFEWFIFYESTTAPATPTGGSWNFLTNVGVPPAGWSSTPPTNPTHTVWASISIVNSRSPAALTWTAPATWTQQGPTGTAATIAAGTTTTGAPGTSASVTNSGTSSAAVFNFQIPRGDVGATGATGATGTAATVAVGTTTTLSPGSSATVTNSGTTAAAVFNFGVPQGLTGATGATGATGPAGMNWRGNWSSATFYSINDGVFDATSGSSYIATATSTNQQPPNGSYWNLLAQKGANGTGVGTVTSVDVSGGTTGLTSFGGPVTSSGTVTLAGTLNVANGGTGATTAANARTSLGATTVGSNLFTLANPGAITFPRFNADNTVSSLDAATFRTAIGAGTSSTTGTVTSVAASVPAFLSISGSPITTSGTLAISLSGTALPVVNGGTGVTTSTGTGSVVLNTGASLGSATVSDYETFTSVAAPTYTEGRLWYDSTQKALTYNSDISGNSLHVGQETQLKVRNGTGSTIAKGAPVYITSTSSGQSYPNVALAIANTLTTGNCIGLTNEAIASGADGYVVISGILNGVNTGTFTVGDILYVSPYSAGQLMNTFPPTGYPVKIGVVSYVNSSTGSIYINQSNAFVQASSVIGTVAIANGGTGQTTANAAFNALVPSQTSNSGKYLTTDGTNTSWATNPLGTVTSVDVSGGTTGLTTSGGPVTTSGTITLAGTLAAANGGTGQSSYAIGDLLYASTTSALSKLADVATGNALISGGVGAAPSYGKIGLATHVSGTLPTANGGTGLTSFTANGVVYASSTSALTTGSALYFDGTNLGVGTTSTNIFSRPSPTTLALSGSANAYIQINGATGNNAEIDLGINSVRQASIYTDATAFGLVANTNIPMLFSINNAEQMRLTSTGLGIGTSSPSAKLQSTASSNQLTISESSSLGATFDYRSSTGNLSIATNGINPRTSPQLVLDLNGNLGIGTSSPAQKLDVRGYATIINPTDTANNTQQTGLYFQTGTTYKAGIQGYRYNGSYEIGLDFFYAATGSGTYTLGMRLDSSGNLGLGVTPSAWTSKAIQIGSGGSGISTVNGTEVVSNAYYSSGTWRYVVNAAASWYSAEQAGAHKWYQAASGTAGNAITFTQAMTLDASGNLGVGTTSASARLHVDSGSTGLMGLFNSSNANGGYITGQSSGTSVWDFGTAKQALNVGGSSDVGINARSGFLAFGTGSTERARIDSSGNLGVGTASPSASAIIDAQSTTKGVRFPNMTTTQKNAVSSPAAGLVVFDTTLAKLCVYSGSAWQTITSI